MHTGSSSSPGRQKPCRPACATPQSPLAAALGEYGRIVRTNFLLLYCADPAERARIAGQLNKGETLHALRRHLVIGSRAQIPADEDDHRRHALCLQILINAVQVWNARYVTASTVTAYREVVHRAFGFAGGDASV